MRACVCLHTLSSALHCMRVMVLMCVCTCAHALHKHTLQHVGFTDPTATAACPQRSLPHPMPCSHTACVCMHHRRQPGRRQPTKSYTHKHAHFLSHYASLTHLHITLHTRTQEAVRAQAAPRSPRPHDAQADVPPLAPHVTHGQPL